MEHSERNGEFCGRAIGDNDRNEGKSLSTSDSVDLISVAEIALNALMLF